MHATNTPPKSLFKSSLMFGRVAFAGVLILATAVSVRGQEPTPEAGVSKKEVHWHKYINHQYGFSFWYPDAYKLVQVQQLPPERAQYFPYLRYLVSLENRDDPEVVFGASIELRPFDLSRPRGDVDGIPPVQHIGHHFFYPYLTGSMGVGFTDNWDIKLKGKTLTLSFSPGHMSGPFDISGTPPCELKILQTFRTF